MSRALLAEHDQYLDALYPVRLAERLAEDPPPRKPPLPAAAAKDPAGWQAVERARRLELLAELCRPQLAEDAAGWQLCRRWDAASWALPAGAPLADFAALLRGERLPMPKLAPHVPRRMLRAKQRAS